MNKSRRTAHRTMLVSLGQAIQARRRELEISQEELSQRSGVDRAFISEVERGQRNPSIGAVASIADGLKMKLSLLITRTEKIARSASESTQELSGSMDMTSEEEEETGEKLHNGHDS